MDLLKKTLIGMLITLPFLAGCSATGAQTSQSNPTVAVQPAEAQPSPTAPAATSATAAAAPTVAAASPTVVSPTSTTAPNASPTTTNPLQGLADAASSLTSVTTYRMTITIVGGTSTQNGTTKIELANGGDFHVVSTKGEFYLIGKFLYVKQGANGTWMKLANNLGTSLTKGFFAPRDLVTRAAGAKNVSLIGPDILNGKPMLVYQYTPDPTTDPNTVSAKAWIGVPDGLPYQVIALAKDGATTTVVFSDYNASITLTPPIP